MTTLSAPHLAKVLTKEQIEVLQKVRDLVPVKIEARMLGLFRMHKLVFCHWSDGTLETTPKGRRVLTLRFQQEHEKPVVGVGFNEDSNSEDWSYFVHVKIGGVKLVSGLCSKKQADADATRVRAGLKKLRAS